MLNPQSTHGHFQCEVGQDAHALLHFLQPVRRRSPLSLKLLSPHSIPLLVNIRQLDLTHVLLQSSYQRQLKEGLSKKFNLVADLTPNVRVDLQHQQLNLIDCLVNEVRLRRNVIDPLRHGSLDARAALDLLWDSSLGVLQGGKQGKFAHIVVFQLRGGFLQEHPRVRKCRMQRRLEQADELIKLTLRHAIVYVEDELADSLVRLDKLRMLRVQHTVQLLVRRAFQTQHELHDGLLLHHEEPPNALPNVLYASLKW
mmetsp:Transcript_14430/g.39439  ORF Transcript_14430/g.39439 Transcript_14430/m.39439 type:complete len:255 (-) Transcript_14430:1545-2309(-)